ncbi:SDR family oxidoreductase [Rubellimicrobium rubrum]|uniref:SDR family oxidoreductase n=1 Tax=Rubellimicrobium rubrum TaxID=2585369 RepID=A0A5C4MXP3_9RHOB|nr:SDR family oxidoreductase [Rubellimicrobium rubrum]TNC50398.1 SDR family oxidoreductase [Rubellimicrobium rubrum]
MNDGAIVVTNAESRLGQALCRELSLRGHAVVGLVRKHSNSTTMPDLQTGRFRTQICNVADPLAVSTAFERIRAALGPIDILINNTSLHPRRDIMDESAHSFMDTIAINLGGTVNCTREALNDMVRRGQGRIVDVGGPVAPGSMPGSIAYTVSRGATQIFSRALVADLADRFPRIVISHWMPEPVREGPRGSRPIGIETLAHWGASLALMRDPNLNGTIWELDRELPPARSFVRRVADRVLWQTPHIRRLPSFQLAQDTAASIQGMV